MNGATDLNVKAGSLAEKFKILYWHDGIVTCLYALAGATVCWLRPHLWPQACEVCLRSNGSCQD